MLHSTNNILKKKKKDIDLISDLIKLIVYSRGEGKKVAIITIVINHTYICKSATKYYKEGNKTF